MHTAIFVHLCMPVFLRCLQGTPWRVAASSRFNAFLCGGSQRQTSPTVSPRGLRVSRNRAPAANGLPPLRQRTAVARQAAAEVEARVDESGGERLHFLRGEIGAQALERRPKALFSASQRDRKKPTEETKKTKE
ncbi:hypothetical protein TGVAND_263642 [Toxoplasma gondii VAND]|uniref:Uncharacterized protein n=2 Tax=Toxoplasma gondii TaxID=5811 RepID=A0A086QC93_TOXGO|nr:hypothetical protein TGVAND_263642 [Toxoplasma gondii VAND]